MGTIFYGCSSLTSLDLSGFDTSNIAGMAYMFYGCSSLTSLDLSGFDTSNVADMAYMFSYCSSLTSLDLSGFDTSKVTSMAYMFQYCSSLTSLDVSHFDTSNVTDMGFMFRNCSSLSSLDLSGFDTSEVKAMYNMFSDCSSLSSLDLSGFDTSKVITMSFMFSDCSSLASLSLGPSFGFVIETIEERDYSALPNIKETDTYSGKWQRVSDRTTATSAELMERSDLQGTWEKQKKAHALLYDNGDLVFQRSNAAEASRGVVIESWTDFEEARYAGNEPPWTGKNYKSLVTKAVFKDKLFPASLMGYFSGCDHLATVEGLSNLDVSKVMQAYGMDYMFANCKSLTSVDFSQLGISRAPSMRNIFLNCLSLEEVDLSAFTEPDFQYFFDNRLACQMPNLKRIKLSGCATDFPAGDGIGAWYREGDSSETPYTEVSLKAIYKSESVAGTYVWRPFATKVASDIKATYGSGFTLDVNGTTVHLPLANIRWRSKDEYYPYESAWYVGEYEGYLHVSSGGDASIPYYGSVGPVKVTVDHCVDSFGFTDLDPNAWYLSEERGSYVGKTLYLDIALSSGMMRGYDAEPGEPARFGPDDGLTRGQFATILYRYNFGNSNKADEAKSDDGDVVKNETGLPDVKDDMYYTAAVNWAVRYGIVTGYKDEAGNSYAFGPDDPITREQMAAMVYRWYMYHVNLSPSMVRSYWKAPESRSGNGFNAVDKYDDSALISDYAYGGMVFCNSVGMITGYGGTNTLGPQDGLTRCQMAKVSTYFGKAWDFGLEYHDTGV